MLRKANNVYSVLLNNVDKLSSNLPAVGAVVTDANLERGAIVLCDMGMRRMDNTAYAAADKFFVVQGKGAGQPLMKSPMITKATMSTSISKFKPAVQQVTYVGYNGTSGALAPANATDYWIKIRKRDNDAANRSQPFSLFAGPVRTTSTSQLALAIALQKNGVKNFAQEPARGYLAFEAVCNDAGSAITVQAGADLTDLGFVKGSKTVTGLLLGVPALGTDEVITGISVGDYLRAGTATTAAVYKVTAITAGTATTPATLTLDIPFQAESISIAYGSCEYVTASNAASANWGVKLTGIAADFNVNTFRDYYANRFTVTFNDTTIPVTSTGAQDGNGVWQKVAMDEYMSYGFEGENNQLAVPSIPRDQEVKIPGVNGVTAATAKYSALNISWEETITGLVSRDGGKGNVLVYLNLDSAGDLDTTTANNGETFVVALGLTAADFDE
jgi:hypothetical protein